MKEIKNNLYMLRYIWQIRKIYVLVNIFIGILNSATPIIMNIMIKEGLDVATISENYKRFLFILAFYVVYVVFVSFMSNYYNNIYSKVLEQDINEKLLNDLYNKSIKLPISSFDNHDFFNSYNFILSNAIDRAYFTVKIFSSLISGVFGIGLLITLIITIDPIIIMYSVIISLVNFTINLLRSKLSYTMEKGSNPYKRKMGYVGRIFYLRDFAKDLRTTNLNAALKDLYKEGKNGILTIVKDKGKTQNMYSNIQTIFQAINMAAVMIYLSMSLIKSKISAGEFAAVFNSFSQLSSSIETLLGFFPQIYKNSLYIEDFIEFLEYPVEEETDKLELASIQEIEFRNVYFSYNQNIEILKNLNIKIKRGEKIALVGKNGAGKSTIANILQGHYNPTFGEVLINKKPIKFYTNESIYNKVGILYQDYKIYGLSILENIIMDNKNSVSEKDYTKIQKILREVSLDNKIEKLPNKLHTYNTFELDKDGANFSGGELQKIALSRVLFKDYDVILLDEPSSALDTYAEKEIFDQILNKYVDKSIILISHRLANVINVDRIYYIENGEIIEEGTHEELIKLGGFYCKLFTAQSKSYIKIDKMK